MYVGYTIIWLAVFVYILRLQSAQKKMKRELRILKEVVNEGRGRGKKNL
jgi:CcmD family protein